MQVPPDLKYTPTHEWVLVEGTEATVGITDHAQSELGDIVYVELPEPGRILAKGDVLGTVESVKAVSDLYSPLSGEVVKSNRALADTTETVNQDPYGEGWTVRVRMSDPSEINDLLDASDYQKLVEDDH